MSDKIEVVWLRDLDGTGSMHVCAKGDTGAVEYVPRQAAEQAAATRERELVGAITSARMVALNESHVTLDAEDAMKVISGILERVLAKGGEDGG